MLDEQSAALAETAVRQRLAERSARGELLNDLTGEAIARICSACRRAEILGEAPPSISKSYALAAADSVYADHLRAIRPEWCRLKRRIVYLLDDTRKPRRFARWRIAATWVAGFARWSGKPFRANERYRLLCDNPAHFCDTVFGRDDPARLFLPELLSRVFSWLNTPLEVDDLTTQVAAMQRLEEPDIRSLDDPDIGEIRAESADPASIVIDRDAMSSNVAALWEQVSLLPDRQRAALLLAMPRDELLLLAGTAGAGLAAAGIASDARPGIWSKLPCPDALIGSRLGITPKQAANLRKCARERLARRLAYRNHEQER